MPSAKIAFRAAVSAILLGALGAGVLVLSQPAPSPSPTHGFSYAPTRMPDGALLAPSKGMKMPWGETIPEECIFRIPRLGATVGPDRVAHFEDGTSLDPPPPCDYLKPGGQHDRLQKNKGPYWKNPTAEGDFPQGQNPYTFAVQNPYDGQVNLFQDAGAGTCDAQAPFIECPIPDAGYAFITQVVGWFVAPPLPASSTGTATVWPGIGFTSGQESTAGVAGGSNVLQPLLIRQSAGFPWSFEFVFCCDAYLIQAGLFGNPLPGDTLTMEMMLDTNHPCPSNGLGCYWIEGINDTGEGGAPDANFGSNYLSIYTPPIEGPAYEFAFSLETFGGTDCTDLPGGANSSITWHTLSFYESALNTDGGLFLDGSGGFSPGSTLAVVAPWPIAAQSGVPAVQSGFGYWVGPGLSSTTTRAGAWNGTTFFSSCSAWTGCNCDAAVDGTNIILSL